jgi:ABC-type nitrate/sulfonate/bicarbonate transport system substrate-binding protein
MDVYPVYATDQPDLARSKGAEVEVIVARDFGVTLMGDVLFATEEFVANNPNTTRAFVHATLRGWQDALNNPQEAIQLVAAYNPQLSEEHLQFEAAETIKLVQYGAGEPCPGWNDQSAWEAEQTILLDLAILSAPVSLEQAINNRFVNDYYQQQGITCP